MLERDEDDEIERPQQRPDPGQPFLEVLDIAILARESVRTDRRADGIASTTQTSGPHGAHT